MKIIISQYGRALICTLVAILIVFPAVSMVINENMEDLTYDQSTRTNRDNSYLLQYEAPVITSEYEQLKIEEESDWSTIDLRDLFNVQATINNGNTVLDKMSINYDFDAGEVAAGIHNVQFTCRYVYKSPEGYDIPREGVLSTKLIIE